MSVPLGAPLDRVDGLAKVTGTARYAADTPVADVAHGVLVGAAIAKGYITRIDTTATEAAPGVIAVLTHHNTPRLTAPTLSHGRGQSHLPLQDEVVHHRGQHIAMVVADTLEQAQHAAAALAVDYHVERPEVSLTERLSEAYDWPGGLDVTLGDPAAAPAVRVRIELTIPTQHHHPMEPWATIATWDGDELTLYESTQGVSLTQEVVAATLGIPRRDVRVIAPYLGGGFGAKGFVWPHTVLAAVAARVAGRPVKLVLTRAQSATAHGHRGELVQSVTLGADRDDRLTAIEHTSTSQTSPLDDASSTGLDASTSLYACPNVRVTERLVRLNLGTPTPIRAPGSTGMHALETAMDELACASGIDPVELRLRNHTDTDPATGRPWPDGAKNLRDCYLLGAERFGWHRRNPRPGSMRSGELLLGWGMATACHPYFGGAALPFVGPAQAVVVLFPDGQVIVRSGTQDIGTGTYTVLTQVAADALGVPPDQVRCELGDTALPPAGLSAGSSTAVTVAGAVARAARAVRDQVVRMAIADPRSPLHGATPSLVMVRDGHLCRTEDTGQGETYRDILTRHGQPVEARGHSDGDGKGLSYGAVFVEVHVDPHLGRVTVSRIVGAYDAGRILNHRTARGQAVGGIVWGVGLALTEGTRIDRNLGAMVTTSLSTYLVPTHADIPDIDVLFVDRPDPTSTALGARGLGEVTATGVSAAIVNAVHHATGRRVRDLPLTPDRLL